jgi:Flp pilus assembly protein TadD
MENQKKVRWLRMAYYKQVLTLLFLLLFIAACATTDKTGPAGVEKTPPSKQASNVDPVVKQKYDKALAALREKQYARAEELLQELINTYPNLSGPRTNLGILYFRKNETEKAEKTFLEAIKVNAKSAVSYNHLGIINRNKGNFKQAQTLYEKALEIDQDYAFAHLNLGILLDLYIGDLDKALDHYRRYQSLVKEEDKEVKKWIIDIERRIKRKASGK